MRRYDMSSTCVSVEHMTKMIQVRNVPEDVHRTLKARAAKAGVSLSDYIKRDLEQAAARPSLEEIDARIAARGRSGLRTETVLGALDELHER
jgi:antitoxin FitA